jgi:hypothetical protein
MKTDPAPQQTRDKKNESGFILPIVVIVGLIIGAGLMALSARTFAGLIGAIRQGQSGEAREIAESGMAIILKELNRNYPYLLIEDCTVTSRSGTPDCLGWKELASGGSFVYRTSICPKADAPPQNILGKLTGITPGNTGRYRLISYNFTGDQHQGGTARIKILGERILSIGGNEQSRAIAYVDQELSILPKNCNVPVNTPSEQSGFPGLMAERVSLGNNDIFGNVNGNVLCTNCNPNQTREQLASEMEIQHNGTVSGNLFGGKIAQPPVPTFPTNAPSGITASSISSQTTITAGESNGGRCFTDSALVTHCKITDITLAGNGNNEKITVKTSGTRRVQLYVEGNISLSGNASLEHTGSPTALAIFGKPRSSSSTCSQTVTLGGGGSTVNLFLFMPDACVSINGGSGSPDIQGALWVREYQGSNSNNADISVPDNMGSLTFTTFGSGYALGIREFAALGTNRWTLVQLPP